MFTKSEAVKIASHSLNLISNGYISGFNRITFPFDLNEKVFVLIHYLQDSIRQIDFIKRQLVNKGMPENIIRVINRETYYLFDPEYAEKVNFREEYIDAKFRDSNFEEVTIEKVVEDPEGKIVVNNEFDMIINLEEHQYDIANIAQLIHKIDKEGPELWIHPAIIVRSAFDLPQIPNFILKPFVYLQKGKEIFYTVVYDDKRSKALKKYILNSCKERHDCLQSLFKSMKYEYCCINEEFDEFMKKNLSGLKQLF